MKTDIIEELKMGKRKKENQIRRQKADFQRILDSHTLVNVPQVFTHGLKARRSAKCSGLNCKKSHYYR